MSAHDPSEFNPIANPYIVGNPIKGREMFFGREDDFEFVKNKLTGKEKGGLLILCGSRRSGKTSILFQIKGGRLGRDYVPILLDMQSMTVNDDKEFLAKLAHETIRAVGHPEISYERDYLAKVRDNPFSAFEVLIGILIQKIPDKKLVLMFDEYELFETHIENSRITTDILNLLASWMERRAGVFMIFTGSDRLETRQQVYWLNFLGKALYRRISFLSRDDTFRLIEEPIKGLVHYEEGITTEIYRLTAGQPFYTQVVCQSFIDTLNEQKKTTIDKQDLKTVIAELVENPLPQMIFSWSTLTDVEKLCLSCMAEIHTQRPGPIKPAAIMAYLDQKKTGFKFIKQQFHEALERLFHNDLIDKSPEDGTLGFKMDLWRSWVNRMHSLWQVIDEISESGRRVVPDIRKTRRGRARNGLMLLTLPIIIALAAGYAFWQHDRGTVSPDPPGEEIAITLPDSATITIASTPEGAGVLLDNRYLGKTPIRNLRVPAAVQLLKLDLTGYAVFSDTLFLSAEEVFFRDFSLQEITGDLIVTSSPPGAEITLDGKKLKQETPATIRGLAVRIPHSLELALEKFEPRRRTGIMIARDSVITLEHKFKPITFPLYITTRPESALVFLDGRKAGQTPLPLEKVAMGPHNLEFRKTGYETVLIDDLDIPQPDNNFHLDLVPRPLGELVFTILPYGDIWINGERIELDTTNMHFSLPGGIYEIVLKNSHFSDQFSETITIDYGETRTLSHHFRIPREK